MILLLGAALAVLSIAVVVYPFLKSRSLRHPGVPGDEVGARHGVPLPGALDLESIYSAIRTLQLEYQLGQVPEAVYQEQLRAYRLEAAAALLQQAQAGAGVGVDGHASPLQAGEQ